VRARAAPTPDAGVRMGYEIRQQRVSVQPILSIRGVTTRAMLDRTIAEYLTEIWHDLDGRDLQPSGPPFTRIHQADRRQVEVEAGFPVPAGTAGRGRIEAGELPGGEVVSTMHTGPYEDLPAAGDALDRWVQEHGRTPAGPNWEVYWTDPGEVLDPEEWRTEVVKPLRPVRAPPAGASIGP
jgi:AraC family transcriptional regulator